MAAAMRLQVTTTNGCGENEKTMKKLYETPTVEKIKFNYRDQVVAASGDTTTPRMLGTVEEQFCHGSTN